MYAIIKTGGKQYKVAEGESVRVEKLFAEDGATVTFDEVLLVEKDGKVIVGNPTVANATVTATVDKTAKGKKIIVFKYRSKKHSKTKNGHRQPFTQVTISKINA